MWRRADSSARALAGGITIGVMLAAQAFFNGRLGDSLGTAELAGAICMFVALIPLVALGFARGGFAVARRSWQRGHRPRRWHIAVTLLCALPIVSVAHAAPKLGVALVTVGIVAGQTVGSMTLDAAGIAPGGRRPLTLQRLVGATVAISAVLLTAFEGDSSVRIDLLFLMVGIGGFLAVLQVVTGHLAEVFDDSTVAATAVFAGGLPGAVLAWLVASGGGAETTGVAVIDLLAGGLLGAGLTVGVARTVAVLGSLALTLTTVAGQSAGAVAIDLIAPGRYELTAETLISLGLVFVAVFITAREPAAKKAAASAVRAL